MLVICNEEIVAKSLRKYLVGMVKPNGVKEQPQRLSEFLPTLFCPVFGDQSNFPVKMHSRFLLSFLASASVNDYRLCCLFWYEIFSPKVKKNGLVY
jgi:hypothetical protein